MSVTMREFDGWYYGWRWVNGDEAWFLSRGMAERHSVGLIGPGAPIRRRVLVGPVEEGHDPEESP